MARIEAAAARIANASGRPAPGGDAALAAENQKLRQVIGQSLHELDTLIEALDG